MSRPSGPTRGRKAAPLMLTALLLAGAGFEPPPGLARAPEAVPVEEAAPPAGAATPAAAAEPTLQEQIEQLRRQLLVLERKAEIAAEAAVEEAKTTVTASAKEGFSLQSNDGAFTLRLRGYLQADGRFHGSESAAADTLLLRRVRPIVEGTVGKRFGFRIMPDFGGGATSLQDAYVDWKLGEAAVLRVGKLKPPVGLERLQSGADITFAERALPTALVPNRDVGVQLGGQLGGGRLEYQLGLFNGVVDGGSGDTDADDGKDVAARLWATPWKGTPSRLSGLSFGVAATHGDQQGTPAAPALPAIRTAGQQTFFSYRTGTAGTAIADGNRFRLTPQLAYFDGPLGVLAEHVTSRQEVSLGAAAAELASTAWQVTAIWVLSGENASYRWYSPAHSFHRESADPAKRGWGGFALTARYNAFAADADAFPTFAAATAVQEASGWAVGLDWTLQRQTRLLVDYERTSFAGRGVPRADEEVLFTRLQIGW